MIKKTIKYEGFDGEEKSDEFYFHFSQAEAMELELQYGGLERTLELIQETDDGLRAYHLIKEIVLAAVGHKSPDGKQFVKNESISSELEFSPAWDELMFDMIANPGEAAKFMEGMLPAKLLKQAKESESEKKTENKEKGFEDYTRKELLEMDQEKFQSIVPKNVTEMSKEQLQVSMERRNNQ